MKYKIICEKEHCILIKRAVEFCQNLEDGNLIAMADIIPMKDEAINELRDIEIEYIVPSINVCYNKVTLEYKQMDANQYWITGIRQDINLVSNACDLVSRLHACQFNNVADFVSIENNRDFGKYHELRYRLDGLKQYWGLSRSSSHGIYSREINDDARSYWDIYQVIRNRIAYDDNPGITPENRWEKCKINMDFDEPRQSNPNLSLIKIEKVKELSTPFYIGMTY